MRNLILTLTLFISFFSFCQIKVDELDSIIYLTTNILKEKKIVDVFFISESHSETVAREIVDVEKNVILKTELFNLNNYTLYVFWKENFKLFLQKIDNSNKFIPIIIDDFGLFEMIKKNIQKINYEKVLEYQARSGFKKVTLMFYPFFLTKLYFYDEKKLFIKEFNRDNLSKSEYTDGKNINLNYKSNSKLKMIEIYNICNSKIEEAKENKLFLKI